MLLSPNTISGRRKFDSMVGLVASIIAIVICLFPFYIALLTSFETGADLYLPNLLPVSALSLQNYFDVFNHRTFVPSFINSAIVSSVVTVIGIILSLTAAYALARLRFPAKSVIAITILSVSMFPQISVLAGLFEVVRELKLFNSLYALMISYMLFTLPFTVWVLMTFLRDLPKELEEAAIVDGANHWQVLVKIFLPISAPAIVTTGLLAFIHAWNEFLFALSFVISAKSRTVPVTIATFQGIDEYELPWGMIMAGSVLTTIPIIVLVLLFQNRIVSGLTAGAVKG